MLLRASGEIRGEDVNLHALTEGADVGSGVPGGDALIAFVDAAVARDDAATAMARDDVRTELGDEAMVEAAAVIGNFERMVRIADGSGIPLDGSLKVFTADLREDLGLESFGSSANTPAMGILQRLGARLAQPLMGLFMRRFAGR